MADRTEDDERTTAVGLFNTARSYWRSAEHLNVAKLNVTHPHAPTIFLFCHAIELYLKAFLRGKGQTIGQLKTLSHRIAALAETATKNGLKLDPEHSEILTHIQDDDVALESRYIVTGFKQLPTIEALSAVAADLDNKVCSALKSAGLAVRSQAFSTPPPLNELSEDTTRVLVYLFKAQDYEDGDVDLIAPKLEMEKGILRYHLDKLQRAGFANVVGFNFDGTDIWALTAVGRKHAVERRLVST
jgi:DNA-binding MarR family transcriptional regulator